MKRWAIIILIIACSWIEVRAKVVDSIVAIVNGDIITYSALKKQMLLILQTEKSDTSTQTLTAIGSSALNGLIDDTLILQRANVCKIEVSDEEIERAIDKVKRGFDSEEAFNTALVDEGITKDELCKEYADKIKRIKIVQQEVSAKTEITEDELRKFQEETVYEIKVRHILVKRRYEAKEIQERLSEGESFEALAKECSTDQLSAEEGGLINSFFHRYQMLKEFSDAAFAIKEIGQLSPIVKTKYGYHIIQLVDKRPLPRERQQELITQQEEKSRQQKFGRIYPQWIKTLRIKAYIKLYPVEFSEF